jgi:hypothetical protein
MFRFWRLCSVTGCALLFASAAYAQRTRTPIEQQVPCESYSDSAAVFIAVASAPVDRWVQLPDHPPLQMKLTPMTVERAYVGVKTPVMYLMPLGTDHRPTPGRRYLVYGRHYHPPDIVMASPPSSAKEIAAAAADIAFLETLMPGVTGGTISGVVRLKDRTYDGNTRDVTPLDRVVVRIFTAKYATEAVTDSDGQFSVTVPAGTYELKPDLPEGVVTWDSTSEIQTSVADSGCSVVTIDTQFNGRVRGALRGPDGRPLTGTSVDLVPMDIERDRETGHVKGMGSVSTNAKGEFEFAGRPPGRYYLGVGLYNGPNANGPSYPRTYYPGTTDEQSAIPVIVERGRVTEGHDFSIPMLLEKGEVEVVVESGHAGELTMCYRQLPQRSSQSRYRMRAGVALRMPVVDGQQYEVHAHLDFPGGHLESEPFIVTGTTGKTIVKLRPDAPRNLHQ